MSCADLRRRVVVDCRAVAPRRDGLTTYITELVPRLRDTLPDVQLVALASQANEPVVRQWRLSDVVVIGSRPMWPSQNVVIPRALRRHGADLFFYPAHDPPTWALPCPLLMTVHDLTPLVQRPYFESHDRLKRRYLQLVTGRALRQAARVLAASGATKSVIERLYGDNVAHKTRVVYYAGRQVVRRAKPATEPYFLYIGTDRPHKNLPRLIAGYAAASHRRADLPRLVLAGGFRRPTLVEDEVRRAGLGSRVVILGHVSDEDADTMLADATALVMPSLAEGFGLPILDAMASGVPVITSDRSACAEIAGDAAVLVDPTAQSSIASAVLRVAGDLQLRLSLAERGRTRASAFDWEQTAAAVGEEIRAALRLR